MNPSPLAREFLEKGRSETCPIISLHGHLGAFPSGFLPSAPIDRFLKSMDRCGVRLTACMHHVAMTYDVERGNSLMQQAIDAHPDRLLGFWVINPNYPRIVSRDLETYGSRRGFIGFKLWSDYHEVPITSPRYAPALEYADANRLLVIAHCWGGSPFDAPELVGEVASRYPGARFLMAHGGQPDWEVAAAVARDLPNAFVELSSVPNAHDFSIMPKGNLTPRSNPLGLGAIHVSGVIEYLVNVAGSSKIVFGSDLPWYSLHYHAGAVLFAQLDDGQRRDIFFGTAERLITRFLENPLPGQTTALPS
jgi:predicted TIM-barrel fold metal-dependent hydrolase